MAETSFDLEPRKRDTNDIASLCKKRRHVRGVHLMGVGEQGERRARFSTENYVSGNPGCLPSLRAEH